jgi:hypothetical protein
MKRRFRSARCALFLTEGARDFPRHLPGSCSRALRQRAAVPALLQQRIAFFAGIWGGPNFLPCLVRVDGQFAVAKLVHADAVGLALFELPLVLGAARTSGEAVHPPSIALVAIVLPLVRIAIRPCPAARSATPPVHPVALVLLPVWPIFEAEAVGAATVELADVNFTIRPSVLADALLYTIVEFALVLFSIGTSPAPLAVPLTLAPLPLVAFAVGRREQSYAVRFASFEIPNEFRAIWPRFQSGAVLIAPNKIAVVNSGVRPFVLASAMKQTIHPSASVAAAITVGHVTPAVPDAPAPLAHINVAARPFLRSAAVGHTVAEIAGVNAAARTGFSGTARHYDIIIGSFRRHEQPASSNSGALFKSSLTSAVATMKSIGREDGDLRF